MHVVGDPLPLHGRQVHLDVLGRRLLAAAGDERVEPELVQRQVVVRVLHEALVVVDPVVAGQRLRGLVDVVVRRADPRILDPEPVEDQLVVEQHVLVDEHRYAVQAAVGAGLDQFDRALVQRGQVDPGLLDQRGHVLDPAERLQVAVDPGPRVLDDQVRHPAGPGDVLVADRVVPGGVLDLHGRELGPDRIAEDGVEVPRRLPALVVTAEFERLEVHGEDEQFVVVHRERLAVPVRDLDRAGRGACARARDGGGGAGGRRGGSAGQPGAEGGETTEQRTVPHEPAAGHTLVVRHAGPFVRGGGVVRQSRPWRHPSGRAARRSDRRPGGHLPRAAAGLRCGSAPRRSRSAG